ncbi:phospholipase [Legionella longbeachae]|uniref:phospholipase n=1 Tax=Legionella longbeachae TaxID=450 RepID=UPI001247A1EB|nr:phospholipase [Legionella longbeachae]QEY51289.1 phospholipase [Legionella longbeachae]
MKKIITALMILLTLVQSSYAKSSDFGQELITQLLERHMKNFSGFEHQYVGDQINLHFYNSNPDKLLHLPNGLILTYGQIVMLGGDLFGDPQHPISTCIVDKRKDCFNLQFYALAGDKDKNNCQTPRKQAENLIKYQDQMVQLLMDWRLQGKTDSDFYKEYGSVINKKLNRLTCGGSFISDYIPFGNYLKLSETNFDHYQPDSLIAYEVGHQVALDTALLGYQQKTKGNIAEAGQLLELAYAQNAFANHYLSDSFASGHIRTPRLAIEKQVFLPSILNLLLANLMHDEDNRLGLIVVNQEGTLWTAYGDNYLFKEEAELQRTILLQAIQLSADSIYDTFESGSLPAQFNELRLVPLFDEVGQLNQTSPLFKVDNGILLKRKDGHDPYNFEWTENWSGLMTLLQLEW